MHEVTTKPTATISRLYVIVAFAVSAIAQSSWAQVYPSRQIAMMVPFPAGGPTDVVGRVLAEHMTGWLGKSVVIENVTGASGNIAMGRVARAAPDGYTLIVGHWSTHVIYGATYKLPFDVVTDFTPISYIATNPQVILASGRVPANDLKELVAALKANPDKMTLATIGPGSPPHIAGVFFQKLTGTRLVYVPYRGAAPALQDLIGGQIDLSIPQAAVLPTTLPHVATGKLKAFAITAKTRIPSAPNIPTVDEAGVPGLHIATWHGIWGPKGLPENVITRLNAAIVDALADAKVRRRMADLAQDIPPREQQNPAGLAAHQKAEISKWWPIIKAANIKSEE